MNIFLSWSGMRSRSVAESLRLWLPKVVNFFKPWLSTMDTEQGSPWWSDLSDSLETSDVGIVCLTRENIDKPWILFEAGRLSKRLNGERLCPYLLDIHPNDLHRVNHPFAQFQATSATRDDTRKLVRTLNKLLGDEALPEQQVDESFEKWWPDLENILGAIPPEPGASSLLDRQIEAQAMEAFMTLLSRGMAATLERFVPRDLFTEISDILTKDWYRADCTYTFIFERSDPWVPSSYFTLRRSLSFKVTNLTNRTVFFPVRSSYSGDEDLSLEWLKGWSFFDQLLIDNQEIKVEPGRNLFEDGRHAVLEHLVELQPQESARIFLAGKEPCRISAARTYYTQGSSVIGVKVRMENEFVEGVEIVGVQMHHPHSEEMTRDGDCFELRRAFLPGQGFEIIWKESPRGPNIKKPPG